jgi:hypothetical protein
MTPEARALMISALTRESDRLAREAKMLKDRERHWLETQIAKAEAFPAGTVITLDGVRGEVLHRAAGAFLALRMESGNLIIAHARDLKAVDI